MMQNFYGMQEAWGSRYDPCWVASKASIRSAPCGMRYPLNYPLPGRN